MFIFEFFGDVTRTNRHFEGLNSSTFDVSNIDLPTFCNILSLREVSTYYVASEYILYYSRKQKAGEFSLQIFKNLKLVSTVTN